MNGINWGNVLKTALTVAAIAAVGCALWAGGAAAIAAWPLLKAGAMGAFWHGGVASASMMAGGAANIGGIVHVGGVLPAIAGFFATTGALITAGAAVLGGTWRAVEESGNNSLDRAQREAADINRQKEREAGRGISKEKDYSDLYDKMGMQPSGNTVQQLQEQRVQELAAAYRR